MISFDALVKNTYTLITQATKKHPTHTQPPYQEKTGDTHQARVPHIITGFSGGPDSLFLLLVLNQLKNQKHITLHAVHLDHQWRKDSYLDAQFCADVCAQHEIPFTCMTADKITPQPNYNGSQEALGRALRRAFFKQIYTQQEADFIALAHQQEDQQETFFIRLMRGATLTGLTCMRPIDGIYIRPLLDIPKQEILDYLAQQKISYRIDPTNTSHDYLRNRIRLKVLPALNECDTRFAQKFNSTLTHLQQEDLFLAHLTQQTFNTVFSHTPQKNNPEKTPGLMGSCDFFRALHPVLQKRLVLYWLIQEQAFFMPSDGHLEEIIKFLASPEGGTHAIAPTWSIHKKHQIFWIEHNPIVAPANSPKSAT